MYKLGISCNLLIELAKHLTLITFSFVILAACQQTKEEPIKIGILHSLTGTMAISESSVVDATQMAINEINDSGGLLGRKIEVIVIDGESKAESFIAGAKKLILEHKVDVIFGGWTSASRKAIKPIVEVNDHILFYPVQYEGLESSPNIIYTGSAPNQQLTPAVKWSVAHLGSRFYLAASDYVFPHTANTIMKKQIYALKGKVVGESYIPLGSMELDKMIDDIVRSKPDVILNTINGDSNLFFFKKLADQGSTIPVMSFSISEEELQYMDIENMTGHYVAASYFQSIKSDINKQFVKDFKQKHGNYRTVSAAMVSGYLGVHLWAKAVSSIKSVTPSAVREALKGEYFDSPEGRVRVSSINNHLWKPFYIGQIQSNGQFKIVEKETKPIQPKPFPLYRPRHTWVQYLEILYEGWNKQWSAPYNGNKMKQPDSSVKPVAINTVIKEE